MFFSSFIHAPEFPSSAKWLNTESSLSLKKLRGHVIVLDFWTYCCINCIHILPDLKYLEEKFAGQPVAIIGVHSAKFKNEEREENILSAIERYGIHHPVVIDDQHRIWESFAVRAWPSFVVIDPQGKVVSQFSGEGHRQELEVIIQKLLDEGKRSQSLAEKPLELRSKPIIQNSTLAFPGKICIDAETDRLFIADSNHHRILECQLTSPTEAKILNVIGKESQGKADGSYPQASFNQPQGLAYQDNQLFVCDTENHVLRQIDLKKQLVATLAGTGEQASWGSTGGGGKVTELSSPWDVAVTKEHLYVAMAGSHQIWKYEFSSQEIYPIAGNGGENIVDGASLRAQLAQPSGLSLFKDQLYFADSEVSAIRKLDLAAMEVSTLIGNGLFVFGLQDGELEDALLQHPLGLVTTDKEIFIADTYNHALRKINLESSQISTLIKRESGAVCSIEDKKCEVLPLNEPNDVKIWKRNLYIADTNNHLIRVFNLDTHTLDELTIHE